MTSSTSYRLDALRLSNSSLNDRYRACPRKFEFAKLYGHSRDNGADDSLAAGVGRALHAAWQTYLITSDRDAATWALMREYPIHLQPTSNDVRSLYAAYSAFLEILEHPISEQYELAHIRVDGVERPAVEVPFRIILENVTLPGNIPVYYEGYIDAILWDKQASRYCVVDMKSTRKSRSDYSAMFKRDPQVLPYGFVLDRILGHSTDIFDVIYFVVYVDIIEPRALKYTFTKTRRDVENFAAQLVKDVLDIRLYMTIGWFPRNGRACDTYSTCIYNDVCDYESPAAIIQYLDLQFGPPEPVDFTPWFTVNLHVRDPHG